jgi:endonuclease-8
VPEGHTLHRLARLHQRRYAGSAVQVSSPQGRFVDAERLDGLTFLRASAWGKHLFHHYDGGPIVHVHLGLYGTFREHRTPMPQPRGAVRMRIIGTDYGTDLRGPTACEVIDEAQVSAILDRLGPDPLRSDADPGLGPDLQVPQGDRRPAHGSVGAGRGGQRLP